jgi:hypothetical protein
MQYADALIREGRHITLAKTAQKLDIGHMHSFVDNQMDLKHRGCTWRVPNSLCMLGDIVTHRES